MNGAGARALNGEGEIQLLQSTALPVLPNQAGNADHSSSQEKTDKL